MENEMVKKLLTIACLGLSIAGLIFVALSIFGKDTSAWTLPAGLFCVVLSNLFNIIRTTYLKNNRDEK